MLRDQLPSERLPFVLRALPPTPSRALSVPNHQTTVILNVISAYRQHPVILLRRRAQQRHSVADTECSQTDCEIIIGPDSDVVERDAEAFSVYGERQCPRREVGHQRHLVARLEADSVLFFLAETAFVAVAAVHSVVKLLPAVAVDVFVAREADKHPCRHFVNPDRPRKRPAVGRFGSKTSETKTIIAEISFVNSQRQITVGDGQFVVTAIESVNENDRRRLAARHHD